MERERMWEGRGVGGLDEAALEEEGTSIGSTHRFWEGRLHMLS